MIATVSEFLTSINNINQQQNFFQSINNILGHVQNSNKEMFYRGQGNVNWELKPSVNRLGLNEYEHLIIKDTLADRAKDFNDLDNMFDKLVKMQHYGIPTRILDLTSNTLSALYFACEEQNEENGVVYCFSVDTDNVKYPSSNIIKIISNLATIHDFKYCSNGWNKELLVIGINKLDKIFDCLDNNDKEIKWTYNGVDLFTEDIIKINKKDKIFIDYLYSEIERMYNNESDMDEDIKESYDRLISKYNSIENLDADLKSKANEDIENIIESYNNIKLIKNCLNCSQDKNCKNRLISNINNEYSDFKDKLYMKRIREPFIIKGSKNNGRIINQDGHFLIMPMDKYLNSENRMKNLSFNKFHGIEKANIYDSNIDVYRILIKSDSKAKILEELNTMGINRSTIYPELDYYGQYIKDKYFKFKK